MTNGLGQGDGKYQKSRTETYHGPLTDISDTDYAMSVSRYDQIMDKSIIILITTYNPFSDSETEDDQLFNSQQCNASTIPFR